MPGYTVRREVRAPRDVVFAVLTDHEGYTALTPLHWTLEQAGTPHPNGVGAVRRSGRPDAFRSRCASR